MNDFIKFSFLFVLCVVDGAYFPNYIVPCKKDDPDFLDCALKHGQNAIPQLVKGDRKLKLGALDPLDIAEIVIDTTGNLKIHLTDSKLYGLSKMQLTGIQIDLDKQEMQLDMEAPRFDIDGTYNISGQILILPIRGNGNIKASLFDAKIGYSFKYDLVVLKGKTYVRPQPPVVTLDAGKSTYHLENLFNGDKQLGDEMNKFLNENDEIMLQEIGPSVRDTISAIAQDIVLKVLGPIPYEELIL